MNLAAVMDDLGLALGTIPDLRVFAYWADRIVPPAAMVGWPEEVAYDKTFVRGADQVDMTALVLVGKSDARSSRDRLAKYADGSGEFSVKAAVEAYAATAYSTAAVTRCEFGVVTFASTEYLAATFYITITGSGA